MRLMYAEQDFTLSKKQLNFIPRSQNGIDEDKFLEILFLEITRDLSISIVSLAELMY